MTRLLAVALLCSGFAHACPDLSGAYVCDYQDPGHADRENLVITRVERAGVVTFNYNGTEMTADGRERALLDDAETRDTTLKLWCDDDREMRGQMRARFYQGGGYAGALELNFSYARVGADLRQSTEGTLKGDGSTLPLSSSVVCMRKN